MKKVFISGMHSGQSPSPGVGIARSLRKAFPDLHIVGIDHWQGASGLHDASVSEVLLFPQWNQINRKQHITQIKNLLDEGHLWISALDVEVYWLAQNLGSHPNLYAPSGTALTATAKPTVTAFKELGFEVPEYISAFLPDNEVHSFLRQNAWQCWLKGPYHEAKRITSWDLFERARTSMQKQWKTSQLFLQRNRIGNEESLCFAAHQGEIVAAIHMEKRLITPEGKTWSGRVTPVSPEIFAQLKKILRELEWSGGGEIEYTQDPDGVRWIIECNPRFPAWIYGAALVGNNLPGRMIAKHLNKSFLESQSSYPFFTRIVQEIAAKESIGIPLPPDPSLMPWPTDGGKGKSGPAQASFIPPLRDTMDLQSIDFDEEELDSEPEEVKVVESIPEDYSREIDQLTKYYTGETPTRIHLEKWTMSRFDSLVNALQPTQGKSPEFRIGYSIKTCPTDQHLEKAKKAGFLMESISQAEIHRALGTGTPAHNIILNGPGKFWPLTKAPVTGLHMLFCDSFEELDQVVQIPNIAACIGLRIRLPRLPSRFGIPVDDFAHFERVIAGVKKIKGKAVLGFHFHMPSWLIGVKRWKEAFESVVTWCRAVEEITGVRVQRLDFGGGFYPSDLEGLNLNWIQNTVQQALPKVEGVYFEPGRSLTQEGEIVISRVLSARRSPTNELVEVVVDACIAELPLISAYAHRIFFKYSVSDSKDEGFRVLSKGNAKVLGRVCMENDILSAGLNIPEDVKIGDFIIFADAGAYERTMSYDFGRG